VTVGTFVFVENDRQALARLRFEDVHRMIAARHIGYYFILLWNQCELLLCMAAVGKRDFTGRAKLDIYLFVP
jgi:hypothetical protein